MKKDTRTNIIEAGIELAIINPLEDISLSQIARKVGVSKAAIYRHFVNKEMVKEAIAATLKEDFDSIKAAADKHKDSMPYFLLQMATLAKEHPLHIAYMLQHISMVDLKLWVQPLFAGKGYAEDHMAILYEGITFLSYFSTLNRKGQINQKKATKQVEDIIELYDNGLHGPFEPISQERKAELFRLSFPKDTDIKEDRYLSALDEIIGKYGLFSVSIGRIARSLGLAPSTLYSEFETKKDLLIKTSTSELVRYLDFLYPVIQNGRNIAEYVYISFVALSNYLVRRPKLTGMLMLAGYIIHLEGSQTIQDKVKLQFESFECMVEQKSLAFDMSFYQTWVPSLSLAGAIALRTKDTQTREEQCNLLFSYFNNGTRIHKEMK